MRFLCTLLVLISLPCGSCQERPSGAAPINSFDGKWWSAADAGERSGLVEGLSDCMTWTAHVRGYSETSQQVSARITTFYSTHKSENKLGVLEVWQKTMSPSTTTTKADSGERWVKPHWYLNGDWWTQIDRPEQDGFVEASLWCLKTQVKQNAEDFSKPREYYVGKIDAFVRANPKLGREAVAITLERYARK